MYRMFQQSVVALACLGMLISPTFAGQAPRGTSIPDVKMTAGGVEGAVVNANRAESAGSRVVILHRGEVKAQVKTDKNGRFRVENLKGGVYQFRTEQGGGAFRLWAERTAPPKAATKLLIVEQGKVVRGIFGHDGHGTGHGGQIMNALSNPWVLAGIVAVAVAVPLALDDDDSSP